MSRVETLGTYTRGPVMLGSKAPRAGVEMRDGRRCVVGGLLTIDVDDRFAFDVDEDVTLTLTLDTTESRGAIVVYDHALVSGRVVHAPLSGERAPRFATVEVALPRARLANRLRLHTDLVIAAPGSMFADPDQRWVAHASEHSVALCDLEVRRSHTSTYRSGQPGSLRITVRDADGRPTAARVGLYDAGGRLPLPSGRVVEVPMFDRRYRSVALIEGWEPWPTTAREAFYVDGRYEGRVPAGTYDIVVAKGPEYRVFRGTADVAPGRTRVLEVELRRWADIPAEGWRSGDGHVHITRTGTDDARIAAIMSAEDLHVSNILQMGTLTNAYFRQPAFGARGRHESNDRWLIPGEETPRTSDLGHHSGLNIRSYHRFDEYHRIDRYAAAVTREGGLFGYMHVNLEFGGIDRSMALGVPLGIGTHAEVLQGGFLNTRLMEDFLNMGFKLVPISGSDFPYITLPGADRTYVRTGGRRDADAWFAGLAAGRAFVTNGPMLFLDVAGAGPGDEIDAGDGPVRVTARARLNPDLGPIDRVELVVHGRVLAVARAASGNEEVSLTHEWLPNASAWIVARAYGVRSSVALTAPIYVAVRGERWFGDRGTLPCLLEKYRAKVAEIRTLVPSQAFDPERWDYTQQELRSRWEAQRAGFDDLVARAEHAYAALEERAGAATGTCSTAGTPFRTHRHASR